MIIPSKGRAIFQDNYIDFQITIPAYKNWLLIIIGGPFLYGLIKVILMILSTLWNNKANNQDEEILLSIFLLVLLWFVFSVLRLFVWTLIGKEIITIGQGQLTIYMKGALLYKPQVFVLNDVRNLRVQKDSVEFLGLKIDRSHNLSSSRKHCKIMFDYGNQIVKFALDLNDWESEYILSKLKEWQLKAVNKKW